jgi:hypothetical protein
MVTINEKNGTGLSFLGFFVFWAINAVKALRADVQAILDRIGIQYTIPEVKARSAFLKAVREVTAQGKNHGLLIRKINKGTLEYSYGLVDETIDKGAKSLDYSHSATLIFNQSSEALTCDRPHRAFDMIKAKYEEYKDYLTAEDIRVILSDIMDTLRVVRLRPRGGVYYVHTQFEGVVNQLIEFVTQLPGENFFAAIPQLDLEVSKRAIYKAFIEGIKTKINDFDADLDGLERDHALHNRVKQFKDLRTEIEFYRDALSFQVDDLTAGLNALEQKLEKKILDS